MSTRSIEKIIPKHFSINYNIHTVGFENIDCYKFEMTKSRSTDWIFDTTPVECHQFDLRNIDQVTYKENTKSVSNKIDRRYRVNGRYQIDSRWRFVTEPLAIEFDS